MKLHLLSIPHTITNERFSHCAFTGKVLKFSSMMKHSPHPYEIIHYGVEGAETEADNHVTLMTRQEQNQLRGHDGTNKKKFVGDDGNTDTPLYVEFNRRLRQALIDRVTQADLVLIPFGHAYTAALSGLPYTMIESGIGYPTLYDPAQFKVYESFAWMHFHQGREDRNGKNYEWVIPNYFDIDAWDFEPSPDLNRVVFLGRISDLKGLPTIVEIARHRPDLNFEICGQGDPTPYLTVPNIKYREPLEGRARSEYLGNARAVLMPTNFTEPFGGVAVEAMLCGTPVLTTTFGAFTETIEDEVTGFRCHTLGDFLAALERAPELDRQYISDRARKLYGYERVAKMYDRTFQQIAALRGNGWYELVSAFGIARVTSLVDRTDPWTVAQEQEREFHIRPEYRGMEQRKRDLYAQAMEIVPEEAAGKHIIDIGGGPESMLLKCPGVNGTSLDPLRFTEEDEARYATAGIARLIQPAEDLEVPTQLYDEAWIYNCLQHVKSPEDVLVRVKQSTNLVRIWEWCHIPTDRLHLHILTADRLRTALKAAGWQCVSEKEDRWTETTPGGMNGDYYAAVWTRPNQQ